MNGIEQLEDLRKRQEELYNKWTAQRIAVTEKLYGVLNLLNLGPAPLLELRDQEMVSIDRDKWLNPDQKWKVRKEIYFVNQDPTRDRSYDFGSSFSLYITDTHITVNHGSCGEWGLEDKGQWSRLILLKGIFDHEQDIIDSISPLIDYSIREELSEVSYSIDEINRAIERAQREKEDLEIKQTIKLNKYICSLGNNWKEETDDQGNVHWKKYKSYVGHEQIINITDKTVTTSDPWSCHHRYKISDLIFKLKHKYLYIVDNKEVTPPEETDSE